MRVAYIVGAPGVPVQGPSGCSAHVRAFSHALSEQADSRLYAACEADRRGRFGRPTPAWIGGTPGWPSWLGRYREMREVLAARRIARRLTEDALGGWHPDVIIERHSVFSDAGWRVSDRLGLPWVLEVNAPLVTERLRFEEVRQPRWARRWENSVLRAAPAIAAVSRWLVDWLKTEVGCRNVKWVPNGVAPFVGDPERGRRELALAEDDVAIGFVGSFKPWHGHDRLAEVARVLGAKLVLVGQRPERVDGLPPEQVVLTGHLHGQRLADVVAALDVGLAPYPADAPPWFCPLKIFDYRAQGVPVVTTEVGDAPVLVKGGGTAVPPDDTDALVEACRQWIGRRPPPRVRRWSSVVRDVLELAGR